MLRVRAGDGWLRACEEIEVEIAGIWTSKGLSMLKHVEPGNLLIL